MNRGPLPLVAIVGRANVGKSTLFNRITGKRRALVSREPGMTRDRRIDTADWCGRFFRIVDTGGLEGKKDSLSQSISSQVRAAVKDSSLVLFVLDGRGGLTAQDQEIAAFLRKADRPVLLLINKMDTPWKGTIGSEFHELGFEPIFFISAEHGYNVDTVLDLVLEQLQLEPEEGLEKSPAIPVVILGKPNAGKSTFLNTLLGEERLITSEMPGTTRDTIDVEVRHQAEIYRFIDTAGIRKKGQTKTGPDKLAVVHARKSLERAEIACLMIDGNEGITHQDLVIGGYIREEAKAIIVLINKLDLLKPEARKSLENDVASKLQFINYAPKLYVSARTGKNVAGLFSALRRVYTAYSKRVLTAQLNAFFDQALANRYLGSYRGKPIKLKYITQTGVKPPVFVLFTNAAVELHFSHLRYLENQLRKKFGFEGATIRIKVRRG